MAIRRQLSVALLISFLWHLLWISSVTIIFLPPRVAAKKYLAVYFLGSILASPVSLALDEQSAPQAPIEKGWDIEEYAGFEDRPRPQWPSFPVEKEFLNLDQIIDIDAGQPVIFSDASEKAEAFSPKESGQKRVIIFQPPVPQYPEWAQQAAAASPVIFKIYISTEGLVEQVVNVQASGEPEIDAALARYVQRWRFTPDYTLPGQWQSVKISLDKHQDD